MKAMLLASGLGTRLRPLTNQRAKPALPFLNVPLLYWAFSYLDPIGIDSLVVNSHYCADQIAALAKQIPGYKGKVIVTHEVASPLGSGGGIGYAREHLDDENFWIANGDEVMFGLRPNTLELMLHEHKKTQAIATIMVMRHPLVGTQFGGVWADLAGRVHGFGKSAPAAGAFTGFHYVGVLLLNEKVFTYIAKGESNIFYDVLVSAIAAGESVFVREVDCAWFETGNPQDYLEAHLHSVQAFLQPPLKPGVAEFFNRFWPESAHRRSFNVGAYSAVPEHFFGSTNILIGNQCHIGSTVQLRGTVVIGDNVIVEEGAILENVVVMPGARIRSGTLHRDCVI